MEYIDSVVMVSRILAFHLREHAAQRQGILCIDKENITSQNISPYGALRQANCTTCNGKRLRAQENGHASKSQYRVSDANKKEFVNESDVPFAEGHSNHLRHHYQKVTCSTAIRLR
jgi:hypothetical protein